MFRIRRIHDDALPIDRAEIEQVQSLLRERFPGVPVEDVESLPARLVHPLKYRFRSLLFVADDPRGQVKGFALVFHDQRLGFLYLDFLASRRELSGAGVGGALYARVREEARALGAVGVFFECLPDDPDACSDPALAKQNASRLRFYEDFGARPIANTEYERPVQPGQKDMPHLVFDDLGSGTPLRRSLARRIVRAILTRRYPDAVSRSYVDVVAKSFVDDPVSLRPAKGRRSGDPASRRGPERRSPPVLLVVNQGHEIHHVRDRGYVQAPVRIPAILREILPTGLFREVKAKRFPRRHVLAVHERQTVEYVRRVCKSLPEGRAVYPYVFPVRNQARPPADLDVRAGYYCMDTFTPLDRNAVGAALGAVDCAMTAADALLRGERLAYALVRPPGHHAERRMFGGFCYFNSGAIAAHFLSTHGRVAMLDVDYHHGNGQQDVFYARRDVLTVSIHGHPRFAYPYFSGFAEEIGEGEGAGTNLNIPLPETVDGARYLRTLKRALRRVREHAPRFLVVCFGLDTARGDPTGTWRLRAADFRANGRCIGELGLPTLVVQEGGYRTRTLGTNAAAFFTGLVEGAERKGVATTSSRPRRTKGHSQEVRP